MPWKQETAQKDADKHLYTKVGMKDGKVKVMSKVSLTGAKTAWAKNPDLIYVPSLRLAGTINDIQAYANASGLDNAALQGAINQGVYQFSNHDQDSNYIAELSNATAFRNNASAAKKAASPKTARSPGRPKGSTNKAKSPKPAKKSSRSPGRPKGSSNKTKVAKSPRGGNDPSSRASRDSAMHQYTKIVLNKSGKLGASGKVKISGADKMWVKDPSFIYLPALRIAGNSQDLANYLASKGIDNPNNFVVYSLNGSHTADLEAEKASLANYNKLQLAANPKSPAKERKKRATSPKKAKAPKAKAPKAKSSSKKGGPRGPRKMTADKLSSRAQKDADNNQYTKIITKSGKTGPSGKVKITGAERMWEYDPDFQYYPNARLAGRYNDVNYYLLAAGISPPQVAQFMAGPHSVNSVGQTFEAEFAAAKPVKNVSSPRANSLSPRASSNSYQSPSALGRRSSAGSVMPTLRQF